MSQGSEFDDTEARRIIQRAAELDAQPKRLDANALREIASEAGISPASVDQALAEHQQTWPTLKERLWRRKGLLITAAVVLAFLVMRLFP